MSKWEVLCSVIESLPQLEFLHDPKMPIAYPHQKEEEEEDINKIKLQSSWNFLGELVPLAKLQASKTLTSY